MKKIIFLLLLSLFSLHASSESLWKPIQELVLKADLASSSRERVTWTQQAMDLADQCIAQHPNEVGCYYYRGQARGIYNENIVFGYGKMLRSLFADWQVALDRDPKFDFGGPYRMFAEVYIALPKHFGPKDLRQNLDLAIHYLKKAIQISKYPTNYLDLAEAYIKANNLEEGKKYLELATQEMPKWTTHPYYSTWQQTIKDLQKELD